MQKTNLRTIKYEKDFLGDISPVDGRNAVNFIVVGGSGYLGNHLVHDLMARKHKVIVFDKQQSRIKDENLTSVQVDIRDSVTLSEKFKALSTVQVDGIFHLAALKTLVNSKETNSEYRDVNVTGTMNVINSAKIFGINNLVFTSSAAVYAQQSNLQLTAENDLIGPSSLYGETKLRGEELVKNFQDRGYGKSISLRCFNLAGARDSNSVDRTGQNLFSIILRCLGTKEALTIYGGDMDTSDGTSIRDYVNVKDAAKSHILAMEKLQESTNLPPAINVCTSVGTSVLEVVKLFEECSKEKVKVVLKEARNEEVPFAVGNSENHWKHLGWFPQTPVQDSVLETLKMSN